MDFRGTDLYELDSLLNELIRRTAREFVDEEVLPIISQAFGFPQELILRLGELGFLGANLEGYGRARDAGVHPGEDRA